jgi:MFS family permease
LRAMNEAFEQEKSQGQERLFQAKYRLPLFLAFSIAIFNQFSGINAILYYLNDIFARAGFSKVSSDLQAVAIGATNLLFTMLAMSIIDHVGRRTLLLIGSVGMALCLAGAAAIFWSGHNEALLVWLLIGFIASFAFSQGAVIWVYLSEIFPTAVRARGQGLGSSTHWVMNALISWTFPVIAVYSKAAPFVLFSGMMVLQFFIVLLFYPETKNIVLEDMEKKLHKA